MVHFDKVAIIGVGLIGGSLARVLKSQKLAGEIRGAGRNSASLERALKLGVIDRMDQSALEAVKGADLVVLASPVGSFEQAVRDIAPGLKTGAILTDVGSVKGELVKKIESMLPPGVSYVPAHPIAGKEKSGVGESSETLFRGARCVITPTPKTDLQALEAVKAVWAAAGANVILMDPDIHDHVFAAVSHLPHVAAYALVCSVADLHAGPENYISYTGGGFRDFTRIAASSPEMWRDICLMNSKNIVEMIERYQLSLNVLKKAIHRGNAAKIEKIFRSACDVRRGLG